MAVKKVPMRMCTGCREMKPKSELIRIVKTPSEEVMLDTTGKMSGRGAYICKCRACLDKAQKFNALSRCFSSPVGNDVYDSLREEIEKLEQ